MDAKTVAVAFALPLCSALASAQAADPTTLEQVSALPRTEVYVSCKTAMWPTLHQVSRLTGRNEANAAALHGKILKEGRYACEMGSTHVLVVFNPVSHQEPVAVR